MERKKDAFANSLSCDKKKWCLTVDPSSCSSSFCFADMSSSNSVAVVSTVPLKEELVISIRRSLSHPNVEKLIFGQENQNKACKRQRNGTWFTDDDIESTRALKQ